MTPRIAALPPGEELIDPATFVDTFSRTDLPETLDPARLEAAMDGCTTSAEATRLALRLARGYAAAAAIFHVRRGVVYGVAADGCSGRPETALFPRAMPSVFSAALARGEAFHGAPPDRTLERRVLRALGRDAAREIAVLPIGVGGRIAVLLYADNGPDPLGDAALAALAAVGERLGRSCDRIVRARKLAA